MKSMCHDPRRNSPSVTERSPASRCSATTSSIASSSSSRSCGGVDPARGEVLAGLQQGSRAQQAADVVGAERRGVTEHGLLLEVGGAVAPHHGTPTPRRRACARVRPGTPRGWRRARATPAAARAGSGPSSAKASRYGATSPRTVSAPQLVGGAPARQRPEEVEARPPQEHRGVPGGARGAPRPRCPARARRLLQRERGPAPVARRGHRPAARPSGPARSPGRRRSGPPGTPTAPRRSCSWITTSFSGRLPCSCIQPGSRSATRPPTPPAARPAPCPARASTWRLRPRAVVVVGLVAGQHVDAQARPCAASRSCTVQSGQARHPRRELPLVERGDQVDHAGVRRAPRRDRVHAPEPTTRHAPGRAARPPRSLPGATGRRRTTGRDGRTSR